jgi:hypothetical protein
MSVSRFYIAVSVLALAGCQASGTPEATAAEGMDEQAVDVFDALAFKGTTYGEAITLDKVTAVSAILDSPETFIGQRVLVEGMVVAVCEEKGCWMDIASDRDFEKVQIKVDDGVIVFPLSAKGKQALVEGVVEQLELTHEQALAEAQHKAEEHGTVFDPSTVTGPQTIYRIRGKGAVIAD